MLITSEDYKTKSTCSDQQLSVIRNRCFPKNTWRLSERNSF